MTLDRALHQQSRDSDHDAPQGTLAAADAADAVSSLSRLVVNVVVLVATSSDDREPAVPDVPPDVSPVVFFGIGHFLASIVQLYTYCSYAL
jgi:hypothetical protein